MKKSFNALAIEICLMAATLLVEAAVRIVPRDTEQGRLLAKCAAAWALESLSPEGPDRPAEAVGGMVQQKGWEEFRAAGLLWWVNRALHLFGWAVVVIVEEGTDRVRDAYPARVKFRGFDAQSETEGFTRLSAYMDEHAAALAREARV
jgi:hypothetical protein